VIRAGAGAGCNTILFNFWEPVLVAVLCAGDDLLIAGGSRHHGGAAEHGGRYGRAVATG
jgi:hypothetical protein